MIVLCLGLPSSASTWAYNIVRGLLAPHYPEMLGVFAETAAAFHEAVPPGTTNVILKAHSLDDTLFRMIEASDSPTIVTWRDPRDCAVSIAQRSGNKVVESISGIQRSAACIISLLQTHRQRLLVLDYADNYMNRIETIRQVARCLDVPASPELIDMLYKPLRTDALRKSLGAWGNSLGDSASFNTHIDLNTHWHKNHMGDGRSNKWREALESDVKTLDLCLSGHTAMFAGASRDIILPWNHIAWGHHDHWKLGEGGAVTTLSKRAPTHLPRGWWRAEFVISATEPTERLFTVAVVAGEKCLAQRLVSFSGEPAPVTLVFEHNHPVETIYVTCMVLDEIDTLPVSIETVSFRRFASISQAEDRQGARRVTHHVVPTT